MKKLFIILIITVCTLSCSKKDSENINKNDSDILGHIIRKALVTTASDSPPHGTLSLGAVRNTAGSGDVSYILNGDFFSTRERLSTQRIEVGQINFGSMVVNTNSTNDYAYYLSAAQSSTQSNSSNFGSTISFSAAGNSSLGIPAFSDNIYVPEIVSLSGPFSSQDFGTQSKVTNLTATWNQDVNNTNGVLVMLIYDNELSNLDDSTLSDSSSVVEFFAPDNGSFTIPASTFNQFQTGSILALVVGRLTGGVKVVSGYRFQIQGYSYASAMFKLTN